MSTGGESQFKPSDIPPGIPMPDGGVPLKAGRTYYSDETRRQLSLVGWQDGDPLPPNFGAVLSELRDEVATETAKAFAEFPEKMAGYVPPKQKIVDIESLPPEKQAEIKNWLAGYKDDVAVMQAPLPQQPQPQYQPQTQSQPQPEPRPEPEPEPERVINPIVTHTHCTRCLWPIDTPFNLTASELDKQQFLVAILGGNDYQKQYDLFGESVRLRVRSLSIAEVTMINVQLGYMVRAGLVAGNLEYTNFNMLFRTALGTVELKAGMHVLYPGVSIDEFNKTHQCTGENPTTLPEYLEDYTKALKSEPVVQIVAKTYREFQRLVELLEEMTNSTDFWKGIVLPGL